MEPRQIYASTVTRRDRRWTRRRGHHSLAMVILSGMTLGAALAVVAALAPGLS